MREALGWTPSPGKKLSAMSTNKCRLESNLYHCECDTKAKSPLEGSMVTSCKTKEKDRTVPWEACLYQTTVRDTWMPRKSESCSNIKRENTSGSSSCKSCWNKSMSKTQSKAEQAKGDLPRLRRKDFGTSSIPKREPWPLSLLDHSGLQNPCNLFSSDLRGSQKRTRLGQEHWTGEEMCAPLSPLSETRERDQRIKHGLQ